MLVGGGRMDEAYEGRVKRLLVVVLASTSGQGVWIVKEESGLNERRNGPNGTAHPKLPSLTCVTETLIPIHSNLNQSLSLWQYLLGTAWDSIIKVARCKGIKNRVCLFHRIVAGMALSLESLPNRPVKQSKVLLETKSLSESL